MPPTWGARISDRLSYANVVASLALFIALGGASYAAVSLPRASVGTAQLRARSVTPPKLAFPLGIATGEAAGTRSVGEQLSPSCFGPTAVCSPPPPRPDVIVTVALSLAEPSQVLLLGSADFSEPGKPSGATDELAVNLGLDNGSFLGEGQVALSEADGFSAPLFIQQTVKAPAGKDRFVLSVSGYVSRSVTTYGAHIVAIALPTDAGA